MPNSSSSQPDVTQPPRKSNRGFASMDKAKQREIASKGGHAAHQKGTAHEFSSEEARAAGRKGGEAVSRDRQHMAEIGREGGQRSHKNRVASRTAATRENTERPSNNEEERGRGSEPI